QMVGMGRRSRPTPNQVILGDALDVMRGWPDDCIDHCIADPPFNMSKKRGLGWAFSSHVTMQEQWDTFGEDEFFEFNVEWLREVVRVVKPNGNILVFGTFHNIYQLGFILQSGLNRRILNSVVWYKPNAQPNITARMLTESTEQLIWAVNGTPDGKTKATKWTFNYQRAKELNNDKQMRNMWEFSVTPRSERALGKHPSQKPLRLLERLIELGTNAGDLVVDPFGGAGTLAVAAEKLGREFVLIESVEEYANLAQARLTNLRAAPDSDD
ncbi:MAG TPA: site-specific DNA-methyltransferase, partial [Dehalococcoidia bacterium]|nr:site-specific DNA-methyltransferase [Dehalococcoidia bacterium]